MKTGFHSTFYAVGDPNDFRPDAWRPYFTPASEPLWTHDTSGTIQFTDEAGIRRMIAREPGQGLAVSYDGPSAPAPERSLLFFAQGEHALGPDFLFLEDGSAVPLGSLLPWARAWQVVEEFLTRPEARPSSVTWVDAASTTLHWPEELR